MRKFRVRGTGQACLNDRLANARVRRHTDLRAMEAKICRVANMSMGDYFQDKLDERVFRDLQKLIDATGLIITAETPYMEVASIIKQYAAKYPEDAYSIDLTALFLHPIWRFASLLFWEEPDFIENPENAAAEVDSEKGPKRITKPMLNEAILRQSKNGHIMKNFYVWMDEYISVLERMFPNEDYQQCFQDDICAKEKQIPMLMEFVFLIINDTDELDNKWQLLLKFMIDPYARLYEEKEMERWEDANVVFSFTDL